MQVKNIARLSVLGVAALATAVSLSGGAVAAPTAYAPLPLPKNSVGNVQIQTGAVDTWKIKDKSIGGWDVLDNTLPWSKMGSDFRANINKTIATSNTAKTTADAAKTSADQALALSNSIPLAKSFMTNGPTKIAKIGGSFATNATVLGTVNLQAGTYLANTNAIFDRVDANSPDYVTPTTDTYPMVALRFDTDSGAKTGDAGTIMGVPVSKAGYVELTQSASKSFTLVGPQTITVYGFGYNEDRSGFGGDQISAEVLTTFVKLR
jgi:hypothetical protein